MDNILDTYTSSELAERLAKDPDYQVVRRFDPDSLFIKRENVPADAGLAMVLDVESTGRESTDRLIELGIATFAYDKAEGTVYGALDFLSELDDPGMPIDPRASLVNGITDEMVAGKRLNEQRVEELVASCDFIIAHNSGFDRPKCEARLSVFTTKPWACSWQQLDWAAEGMANAKLEFLAYRMGFFYDAHRAYMDALAVLNVLKRPLETLDGKPALSGLLDCYQNESHRIWAVNSPFDKKDELKKRGYKWSDGSRPGSEKAWHLDLSKESLADELDFLKTSIYGNRSFTLPVDTVDSLTRFSDRNGRRERITL